MRTVVIIAILAASAPSLAGDASKDVLGLKLGMTSDQVIAVMNTLVASEAGENRKLIVNSSEIFGLPKFVATVAGRFHKGSEYITVSAIFSPPPLPSRLVAIQRNSTYKGDGMALASMNLALKDKFGPPTTSNQISGSQFWVFANDWTPFKLSKATLDDMARNQRDNPVGGANSVSAIYLSYRNGNTQDIVHLLETSPKILRASQAAISVQLDVMAMNGVVSTMSMNVTDLEKSANAIERLAVFVNDAAAKQAKQKQKNAEAVRPAL